MEKDNLEEQSKTTTAENNDGTKAAVEFALTGMLSNMAMKMCDDFVDKNASVASRAGLVAILIRETHGKPCEFCAELAGKYNYDDRPSGVRSRHKGCNCTIEFKTEKRHNTSIKKKVSETKAKKARIASDLNNTDKTIDIKAAEKYNPSPADVALKKQYRKDVNDGWITPLFSEDQYVKLYHDLQEQVVGLKTSNGIEVTDISAHFMARMIGTSRDPKIYARDHKIVRRSGVEMEDIVDTITQGKLTKTTTSYKGLSATFYGANAVVTINPDTGVLIQCNPV